MTVERSAEKSENMTCVAATPAPDEFCRSQVKHIDLNCASHQIEVFETRFYY